MCQSRERSLIYTAMKKTKPKSNSKVVIHIQHPTDKLIGALRVSNKVYVRVGEIAKNEGVSKQEVIRAILEQVIDGVETP